MLSLSFKEWVMGLFRAGFGGWWNAPAPVVLSSLVEPTPPPPSTTSLSVVEAQPPVKPKKKRKRSESAVWAWNARLRSPEADA
ncbi:hypothetical protein MVI01_75160 [Myxococcus virescens]|uniref:Uncharacterized protein n=1 Tax=Myxococcus virescens TaxID=83456 RepID=A0A511HQ65_9BACT|nr:hypothetical protein MVI01_75160 [Myxococcus virescens]